MWWLAQYLNIQGVPPTDENGDVAMPPAELPPPLVVR